MTRNLGDWIDEERAVSPVIGVILMVAITVILAAVIGTFVLDLGQSAGQSAPQASLSVSVDSGSDNVTIEHSGGDAIDAANTRVIIENSNGTSITFGGATDSATLTVGNSVEASTAGTAIVDMGPPWEQMSNTSGTAFGIDSGQTITVTLIDTESQRQIFQTEVTA